MSGKINEIEAKKDFLNKEIQLAIDHTKDNRKINRKRASTIKMLQSY